jgi:ABC-type sugar transport system ATPase subunit
MIRRFTEIQISALRPGMPVKANTKITKRANGRIIWTGWSEVEGVLRKIKKTGVRTLQITVETRDGDTVVRSIDQQQFVMVHKGYLAEHKIILDTPTATANYRAVLEAAKGTEF